MIKKCVVCRKRIKINLDKKGHYDNGHYFGKVNVPIKGTGKYKKVGTSKILGEKIDVVKWTGKEKQAEYWECNECYKSE
tara:strand:- start:271 stop:507 length:237 start_codon:yes stop_codon:yes gene_type:complete